MVLRNAVSADVPSRYVLSIALSGSVFAHISRHELWHRSKIGLAVGIRGIDLYIWTKSTKNPFKQMAFELNFRI
jgi:hypothetical protein